MGRANRVKGSGAQRGVFHVTHRCHNRACLLKFARDRDAYRRKLLEHTKKFGVWILDYCLTSNHVHLLVDVDQPMELSRFMQEVASEFVRGYNRLQDRRRLVSFHIPQSEFRICHGLAYFLRRFGGTCIANDHHRSSCWRGILSGQKALECL